MRLQNKLQSCLLLLASLRLSVTSAGCGRRWCKYRMHCMDESLAMTRWNSESVHGCVLKASSTPDDLMLQWNKQTGVCSLFHYQQVCRMMQASGAKAIGAANQQQALSSEPAVEPAVSSEHEAAVWCSVYRAKALVSCDASLNARLLGVWLAGGSNRFSNLVCQSDPAANYRLKSVNLQWTEEGAQFDGQSSYALLNDSRFVSSDTSAGFTWLMRLRRQPRVQPFMEAFSCYNLNSYGPHLWEFNTANMLYFNKAGPEIDGNNFLLFSPPNLLPPSNDSWINIAISVSSGASSSSALYFNGSFVESGNIGRVDNIWHSCLTMSIGRRFYGSGAFLKGVVRAVAIANASMTEGQIRQLFSLLP